ncbi:hypothetical protein Bca52824_018897 [Brassica carinata]|uniref:Uncharacterized protein n=1 Tax=Brassica carinata TaxID=52824 RepID=A0A8X8AXY9_BRACI|nr:hypothetical protein Bca52824_018897 [Brassica carinata]
MNKYPPAYLSPEASGKNLLVGANFASSAASGYYDKAALINAAVTWYYVTPLLYKVYTPDQYGSMLLKFIQQVYAIGARKIGVTSLPPTGCLPAARILFGFHEKGCVSRLHADDQQFNKKLNAAASKLQKQYSGLKIVVYDIFNPLYDLVQSLPSYPIKPFHVFQKIWPLWSKYLPPNFGQSAP